MSWAQKIHSERLGCVRVPCSWFVSELKEYTRVPAQVHGWAFLSAPGPSGAFLCCQGLLSWKSWTILNPRQTVSHQKCCHNFYLERNQVLSQNCCLTKNRLIGEPKHPAQIRVWSFLQGSSSLELGFGFALPADGYSCEHSLCPPTRHSEQQEWPSQADPRPGHTDFGVLHRARYFGSEMNPWALWLWTISPAQSDVGFQQTLQRLSEALAANSWYYCWVLQSHIVLYLFTGSKIWGYQV